MQTEAGKTVLLLQNDFKIQRREVILSVIPAYGGHLSPTSHVSSTYTWLQKKGKAK